jgi:hypothetical protein
VDQPVEQAGEQAGEHVDEQAVERKKGEDGEPPTVIGSL